MKMLTKENISSLPAIGSMDGKAPENVPVVVKYFTPWSNWTWYVTEGEQREGGDWLFFGLVEGFEKELGYFTLSQLTEVKGPMGLRIERDRNFKANLSEVK